MSGRPRTLEKGRMMERMAPGQSKREVSKKIYVFLISFKTMYEGEGRTFRDQRGERKDLGMGRGRKDGERGHAGCV